MPNPRGDIPDVSKRKGSFEIIEREIRPKRKVNEVQFSLNIVLPCLLIYVIIELKFLETDNFNSI